MRNFKVWLSVVFFFILCSSVHASGTVVLFDSTRLSGFSLTDANPEQVIKVNTSTISNVYVDITVDKGMTLVITPLVSALDEAFTGSPSITTTISNGGGTERIQYSNIAAHKALVTITKTEAGSTGTFRLSVRGS